MQGQGYLYARPFDEKAFEAFLLREHHQGKRPDSSSLKSTMG